MTKKSVTPTKKLARYEPEVVYICGEYEAECVRVDDGDYYLAADADAAIEALQAEIEALRAEVAEWKRVASAQAELHVEAEAHAERLRAEVERSERYAEQSERERLWAEERAERLAEALRHSRWCRTCAEDGWESCEDGSKNDTLLREQEDRND